MKKFVLLALLAVFLFTFSFAAFAQQAGKGGSHVGEFGLLVRNEHAVKTLKLSDDQKKQFDEAVKEWKDKAENADHKEAAQNRMEFTKKVRGILDAEQLKKAQTLTFQSVGGLAGKKQGKGYVSAAGNMFALEALGVTKEQKKSIQEVHKKFAPTLKEAAGDGEKIEKLHKEQFEEIAKVLTPDQKYAADKMLADAPDFLRGKQQGKGEKKEKK